MMESFTRIESFTDFDDATYFMDTQLREMAVEGWELQQGSGVQLVNHQFRVGLNWERQAKKPVEQLELPTIDD
jgi:hypothetical protein